MFYNTLIVYGIQKLPVSYKAREVFICVDRAQSLWAPKKGVVFAVIGNRRMTIYAVSTSSRLTNYDK